MRTGASSSLALTPSSFLSSSHPHSLNFFLALSCTFSHSLLPSSFHSVTCTGHTLFSCTISCNYDDDGDHLPLSPFLSPVVSPCPFASPPFVSLPPTHFLCFCNDDSALPPFAIYRFFLPLSNALSGAYRTDAHAVRSIRKMHFLITRDSSSL